MRLDHIIVSVLRRTDSAEQPSLISVPEVLSVHRMPVLRMKLLIKIGNKMPVAIVER